MVVSMARSEARNGVFTCRKRWSKWCYPQIILIRVSIINWGFPTVKNPLGSRAEETASLQDIAGLNFLYGVPSKSPRHTLARNKDHDVGEDGSVSGCGGETRGKRFEYLETPCRKIFDTRVFSGKKGDKGTKRWHFRKKCTKQKCKSYAISCYVAKLLAGNFRHNSANFWHNSGNFRYKKTSLSRKRLYRRMMTAEPLPRALNLKKDYIPGRKGTIWQNLFFPFVLFFLHTLELLGRKLFYWPEGPRVSQIKGYPKPPQARKKSVKINSWNLKSHLPSTSIFGVPNFPGCSLIRDHETGPILGGSNKQQM